MKLKFTPMKNNAKLRHLGKTGFSLSLLSGTSCPGALDCKSQAVMIDGRLTLKDGPNTKWRCFSASQEVLYPNTFLNRKHNFDLLKKCKTSAQMTTLLQESLPKDATIIRLHIGGDIFNENYFKALCEVATNNPNVLFYAYTKSIHFWVNNLDIVPDNFKLTASRGGRHDKLIDQHQLKSVTVVFSEDEAFKKDLEIDHNDSLAYSGTKDFSLLIHGTQPAGTAASIAKQKLKILDLGSYKH